AHPGCSCTLVRAVSAPSRERTGFGEKSTRSTTSRWFDGTLVTGIEVSPFGSLIAPGGPAAAFTTAVGAERRFAVPSLLRAVTRTRSVLSMSPSRTVYASSVKPVSVTQFSPDVLQRSHWNVNWIGCVPVQVPCVARSVSSTCGGPLIVGGAGFRGAPGVRGEPPRG